MGMYVAVICFFGLVVMVQSAMEGATGFASMMALGIAFNVMMYLARKRRR